MKLCPSISLILSALLALSSASRLTRDEIDKKAALGYRLIDFAPDAEPIWQTEEQILGLIGSRRRFFDVTDVYNPDQASSFAVQEEVSVNAFAAPSHQTQVRPIISSLSLPSMQNYLTSLTAFNNRYYKSETGVAASVWIRDIVKNITLANPASGASVALFNHTSFVQPSIVAKFPGKQAGPVTILGAHMDSINSASAMNGRSAGADDDGSGTVNLLEAFRGLAVAGFKPTTPVEFHWYAAEEGGLRGSQDIATSYKGSNVQVKAMLQFDMTAYVKPGTQPAVALMPDYTDASLTSFVGSLVDTYTSRKWVINGPCGYACSDHASWNKQGYPTALPFEGLYPSNENPNTHSTGDTISLNGFNWEHTFEYAKLAVAFAYELGA